MAMILDAFVQRYMTQLADFVEGEVSIMLKVKDDLQKLQRRLERIRGFLENAERKRHEDSNISNWVRELKDIMYDADDIIDLCIIEGSKLPESHQSVSVVCHPFPLFSCFSCIKFRHEIGNRIRDLNNRLKEIVEDRSALPKLEYTSHDVQVSRVNPRQTFPIEVNSDIVGTQIEDATQGLVDSLVKEDKQKCWILGIVGMGGIGKTTLASKIYNDERIKENFPVRVWVCVSKDFSETELLQEIIRSAGGNYMQAKTKAELIPHLSSVLSKRFIIVLDDIWEAKVWEDLLRYPLESAMTSGRIVITTRDINVAANMRALVYNVDKMDSDDGWALLCKKVFGDDEKEEMFNLKEIGVKIVEKCDGLPLAIKTIAGVLRLKKRSSIEWNKVLISDAWSMSQLQTELPGALFLSYEDLSSDLKQCFLYCSLYPENSSMHRDDLVRYWLAEGFVKSLGDVLLEDLAEDYFKELICRNLLRPDSDYVDESWCRMHQLLRSLALFLIGDESAFVGHEKICNTNPLIKLRRLSISSVGEKLEIPDAVKKQRCLRTLIVWNSPKTKIVEHELERLGQLRVLDLQDTELESLPDSMGNLLHLRFLDLDRTNVKNLPESIGRLQNLQTLNLSGCKSLHTLPKAITSLCNLRCLCLEQTPLSHLPKGVGKLRNLVYLEGFVVGDDGGEEDQGCDLEELQSLSQLRVLQIERLERSREGASALANSCFLKRLFLCWLPPEAENNQPRCGEDAIQKVNKICNDLSPPSNLEDLGFSNFFGSGFPGWLMSSSLGASFPHLAFLKLENCRSCPQLPPLGLLPQLKYLRIAGADAISRIGPELLGRRASVVRTAFPRLEYLLLQHMRNWKEWSLGMGEEVGDDEIRGASKLLPRLKHLVLENCPELIALPEGLGHATNLQELYIVGAHNLREIKNLPSLTDTLYIKENPRLERVSNLPMLKFLSIQNCSMLEQVENLDKLQYLVFKHPSAVQRTSEIPIGPSPECLQDVSNNFDQQMEHLPRWLLELLGQHQNAPTAVQNLRKFELTCSSPLFKSFLKGIPNFIQWIPEVWIEDRDSSSWMRYAKGPPPTFQTNEQTES
ncbi:putative disease resistance protein RGA4 [Elaeis guineensis]|uniref:Disease resistance protein RGA3 n=1 Tax=Elaeis guineensis var. tenera TaxID=51953 RepID=A0A6I9QPK2_ELAGV|nr:putative disease resistance protein RGA3 [Elaeis guineensis]XP_019703505.1 putative disease resistance protein RGA3 [Elaeis guineensis]